MIEQLERFKLRVPPFITRTFIDDAYQDVCLKVLVYDKKRSAQLSPIDWTENQEGLICQIAKCVRVQYYRKNNRCKNAIAVIERQPSMMCKETRAFDILARPHVSFRPERLHATERSVLVTEIAAVAQRELNGLPHRRQEAILALLDGERYDLLSKNLRVRPETLRQWYSRFWTRLKQQLQD
ncbi:MAG TPA: hypothetical protein VGK99_10975 [Acidobacteriota bacterium]